MTGTSAIFILIFLLGISWAQDSVLDNALNKIFSSPKYKSCGEQKECVPQHLCDTGEINDDGGYIIKPRIDAEDCENNYICCDIFEKLTVPAGNVKNNSTLVIPPLKYKSCGLERECVPQHLCDADQINDDGGDIIKPRTDTEDCETNYICCDISEKQVSTVPAVTVKYNLTPIISPSTYKSCGLQRECVPRHLCDNGEINEDGSNLIGIRIDTEMDTNGCEYLDKCCNISDKYTVSPELPNEQNKGCGFHNPNGIFYNITGDKNNESKFGEFPWMVAILPANIQLHKNYYECGGSLITPNVILTVAHCVQNRTASDLLVRAGEWDTQTESEALPHQERFVKEIIIHEKFINRNLRNDIALLILDNPFDSAENVRPICLPESNINFNYNRCYATGWGQEKFGNNSIRQVILKKIDLPIVPKEQCQHNLRMTVLGYRFRLHESFICAGGEKDKDTCQGDGGAPLMCPIPGTENRFFQAGIVAGGIGCGEENVPAFYANVAFLRPWINEKLASRNIDFSHFTPKNF